MSASPRTRLLILTFIATWFEISLLVLGLNAGAALWATVATLGAYHLGYLGADFLRPMPSGARAVVAIAGGVVLISGVARSDFLLVGLGIAPFASFLQAARRALKPLAPTKAAGKDAAKLIAMVAGTAALLPAPIIGVLMSIAIAVVLWRAYPWPQSPVRRLSRNVEAEGSLSLLLFEMLHHAHYFAYCYAFWALVPSVTAVVGPLFVLGWIGYIALEQWRPQWPRAAIAGFMSVGHVLCAAALILMLQDGAVVVLVMWTLTGFAGGTAYLLALLPQSPRRERYEDVGHVVGCALSATALFLTGTATSAVGLAAVLAVLAAVTLVPVLRTAGRAPGASTVPVV